MIGLLFLWVFLLVEFGCGQDVPWETTCVTDPHGVPMIHMENHADYPMVFYVQCFGQGFSIYVAPHTTKALQAYFYYQDFVDFDKECILTNMFGSSHSAEVVQWNIEEDNLSYRFNYTYCSEEPGLDLRLESYTDCQTDADGFVDLNFVNNLQTEQHLYVYCLLLMWNDYDKEYNWYYYYYGYAMEPHSRLRMSVEPYRGEHDNYRTCTFFPDHDGFNFIYYDTIDSYDNSDFYMNGALWCMGRHAFDVPIVKLLPHCPSLTSGTPSLELRADVPAYALARCRNGDQAFTSINEVSAVLAGSFNPLETSTCVFYKKTDVNTFTVDVEVGWGEEKREVFFYQKIHTVSCSYDMHGTAVSSVELISDWFIAPNELQTLIGMETAGTFKLRVLDVLGQQINTAHISIGRKIRLKADDLTGTLPAFRALSCIATNGVSSYPILRAGCGDGVIVGKDEGFFTEGAIVYSPFFNAFKLRGGHTLWFHCRFTVCGFTGCDGSSCSNDEDPGNKRAKRSEKGDRPGIYEGHSVSYSLS